jgi:formylglycine-generating enzyme required for sulfatase activity
MMKTIVLCLILCSSFVLVYGAKSKDRLVQLNCSKVKGDYLWFSNTEVSNQDYRNFLHYRQGQLTKQELEKLLPDTLCWNKALGNAEPFIKYYFRHPSYRTYPVVGVSLSQVKAYCEALTEIINKQFAADPTCPYQRVVVRLPTKEEWYYAAIGGLSPYSIYPWEGENVLIESGKFQGSPRANFLRTNEAFMGVSGVKNGVDVVAPVVSYWPNGYGLYNMSGNVAEWVSDGVVMGGSFKDPYTDIKVTSEKTNSAPAATVGFRYVVEVQQFKPQLVKTKLDVTKKSFYKKNFVMLNDTLSMFRFEVSNELYHLFCQQTNYKRPDSTLWSGTFYGDQQYVNHYQWHAKFRNYPVVNITLEDAEKFCFWLTQHYVRTYSMSGTIRLPSKEEWVLAIEKAYELSVLDNADAMLFRDGNIRKIEGTYAGDLERYYRSIFMQDIDGIVGPADVSHTASRKLKMYNLTANVDELLKDNTVFLTRNWTTLESTASLNSGTHEKPSPTVGFRIVLVK